MLFNSHLPQEATTLTRWLISIPSIAHTKGPSHISAAIYKGLQDFPYYIQHPEHLFHLQHKKGGKSSVIALVKSPLQVKETLVLLCTTDTHSPYHYGLHKDISTNTDELFSCLKENNNELCDGLYGLGVLESKCATGSMLATLKQISDHHVKLNLNVLFICTADSIDTHCGIKECIPFIQQLCTKEDLVLRLSLSARPDSTATKDHLKIYTGNYGQVEPAFYILGKSSSLYSPFSGFSSSLIASELVREIELNAKLTQCLHNKVLTPCFESMRLKEFGRDFSPDGVQVSFSLPIVDLNLKDLLEVLKESAAKALIRAADVVDQREALYANLQSTDIALHQRDAEIVSFSDLVERARHAYPGNLTEFIRSLEEQCESSGFSPQQSSIFIIEHLNEFAQLPRPSIIVYYNTGFIPVQGLNAANSEDRKLFMLLDNVLHHYKDYCDAMPRLESYYAPGDASFMRPLNAHRDLSIIQQECPLTLDEPQSLQVPALSLGICGSDLCGCTEHVTPEMCSYLPNFILSVVSTLSENLFALAQMTVSPGDRQYHLESITAATDAISRQTVAEAQTIEESLNNKKSFYAQILSGSIPVPLTATPAEDSPATEFSATTVEPITTESPATASEFLSMSDFMAQAKTDAEKDVTGTESVEANESTLTLDTTEQDVAPITATVEAATSNTPVDTLVEEQPMASAPDAVAPDEPETMDSTVDVVKTTADVQAQEADVQAKMEDDVAENADAPASASAPIADESSAELTSSSIEELAETSSVEKTVDAATDVALPAPADETGATETVASATLSSATIEGLDLDSAEETILPQTPNFFATANNPLASASATAAASALAEEHALALAKQQEYFVQNAKSLQTLTADSVTTSATDNTFSSEESTVENTPAVNTTAPVVQPQKKRSSFGLRSLFRWPKASETETTWQTDEELKHEQALRQQAEEVSNNAKTLDSLKAEATAVTEPKEIESLNVPDLSVPEPLPLKKESNKHTATRAFDRLNSVIDERRATEAALENQVSSIINDSILQAVKNEKLASIDDVHQYPEQKETLAVEMYAPDLQEMQEDDNKTSSDQKGKSNETDPAQPKVIDFHAFASGHAHFAAPSISQDDEKKEQEEDETVETADHSETDMVSPAEVETTQQTDNTLTKIETADNVAEESDISETNSVEDKAPVSATDTMSVAHTNKVDITSESTKAIEPELETKTTDVVAPHEAVETTEAHTNETLESENESADPQTETTEEALTVETAPKSETAPAPAYTASGEGAAEALPADSTNEQTTEEPKLRPLDLEQAFAQLLSDDTSEETVAAAKESLPVNKEEAEISNTFEAELAATEEDEESDTRLRPRRRFSLRKAGRLKLADHDESSNAHDNHQQKRMALHKAMYGEGSHNQKSAPLVAHSATLVPDEHDNTVSSLKSNQRPVRSTVVSDKDHDRSKRSHSTKSTAKDKNASVSAHKDQKSHNDNTSALRSSRPFTSSFSPSDDISKPVPANSYSNNNNGRQTYEASSSAPKNASKSASRNTANGRQTYTTSSNRRFTSAYKNASPVEAVPTTHNAGTRIVRSNPSAFQSTLNQGATTEQLQARVRVASPVTKAAPKEEVIYSPNSGMVISKRVDPEIESSNSQSRRNPKNRPQTTVSDRTTIVVRDR